MIAKRLVQRWSSEIYTCPGYEKIGWTCANAGGTTHPVAKNT
jgi:hypothetical protein